MDKRAPRIFGLLVLLLFAIPAFGQGIRYDNFVLKPLAVGGVTPVSGALITVCTSAGIGQPCTPKVANIYSDQALTQIITGTGGAGTTNSDANGNYGFYIAPGDYVVTVTGSSITSATTKITLPCTASSGCSSINNIRIVDGVKFTTIQSAITDFGTNPGLVLVPSTYTGAQPTSVPTNISIQTLEVPGWTVLYGNLTGVSPAQESGKLIIWTPGFGGGAVNPTASALPYTASQIQNQFAVNLVSQGPLKIPIGAYINTQVNGDTTLGQSPKDINAVFGNVITGGLTAVGVSDSAVSGEFAVSVNTAGAAVLPLAVGTFGRVNQTAAQNITDVRGVQGAVSTTAGTITNARSVYGIKPVSSGTGSIANAVSGYFDLPTVGTAVNRAIHAEGESSFGGTLAAPNIKINPGGVASITIGGVAVPTISSTDTLSNKTLNTPLPSGTGLQIFSTATTCTTAASVGATCTTAAISLPVTEADTSYRVVCTGKGITNVPVVIATTNSSASQFTITIAALTAAAASFSSYDCMAGHN